MATTSALRNAILNHLAVGVPAQPSSTPAAGPDFAFSYLLADRSYDSTEYPAAGVFDQLTAPWLNDLNQVPSYDHWTLTDVQLRAQRLAQINAQNQYATDHVPGQSYTGTAAEQLAQRFAKGLFDPQQFSAKQIETLTQHWLDDDAEFGRRPLGGANPDVIRRFQGSASELSSRLAGGRAHDDAALAHQLEQARFEQRLFCCDYADVLGPVQQNGYVRNGQFWTVPLVFYTLEPSGLRLMPAAIQLNAGAYWFTPADDRNAWLFAKLHAASADTQRWFSGTHLHNTHSVAMVFGIAALKQINAGSLSLTHPVLMLLHPHLVKLYDVNTKVYNCKADPNQPFDPVKNALGIYQKGQFCDQHLPSGRIGVYQIANGLFQNFRFDAAAFDRDLADRGMDAAGFPASFPYRDDGQVWWRILQTFAQSVVQASYASDAEVASDMALNGWMQQAESAFNRDGFKRFIWQPTKPALAQLLTHLVFLTTAQHTAVNASMFDAHAFVPNGPLAMTAAAPSGPGVSDEQLLAALPNPQSAQALTSAVLGQIDMMMVGTTVVTDLAAARLDERALHDMYPYDPATQGAQHQAVGQFYLGLQQAELEIERNQGQRMARYREANPAAKTVPNSVRYGYLAVEQVMACIQS